MIPTDEALRRTQEALRHLELGLANLRRERDRMHPSWYEVQADPVIEHILRLRAEINEYLGIPADRKPEFEEVEESPAGGLLPEVPLQDPRTAGS